MSDKDLPIDGPERSIQTTQVQNVKMHSAETQPKVSLTFDEAVNTIKAMIAEIEKVVVGQQEVVEQVVMALIAGGHVLIEGVPGLGKTLLVKALAATLNGRFTRVQFTPDLMPSDVTGHALYDMKTERFKIRRGPVFTHFLLADEINRAPAKTQAALLEVMQERQVTIEGQSFLSEQPFMVLATQNPIEMEGTYPLPEAEVDRFLFKVSIDYPSEQEEVTLVKQVSQYCESLDISQVLPILTPEKVIALQQTVLQVTTDDQVVAYAVKLCRMTRSWNGLSYGAGPRASIALVRAARVRALLEGSQFVTPQHVKKMAKPVLRHRVGLTAELEIDDIEVDQVIQGLIDRVEAPRS